MMKRLQKYEHRDRWPNIPWQADDADQMSGWEFAAWLFLAGLLAGFLIFSAAPW